MSVPVTAPNGPWRPNAPLPVDLAQSCGWWVWEASAGGGEKAAVGSVRVFGKAEDLGCEFCERADSTDPQLFPNAAYSSSTRRAHLAHHHVEHEDAPCSLVAASFFSQ